MGKHHEPLRAMGPIQWDRLPRNDLKRFLEGILAECQTVVESIPAPATTTTTTALTSAAASTAGRARSKTDSAVVLSDDVRRAVVERERSSSLGHADDLRKEWKEVKVNPRENPLDINVYKLSAKDGRGSWFARRSVHEGLTFEKWKLGLETEFGETMKVQGEPGSGNIRGIGADKRVEDIGLEDAGRLQVYQLSAQFPGPTSPRDFVTLLLTAETALTPAGRPRPLRQFMIVSKPCEHPECPPRQGFIRGYYESVEIIREVPLDHLSKKRSLSSADVSKIDERETGAALGSDGNEHSAASGEFPTAIEWLMVTRSDPGGSVPRFLIEKGTPPGIVGDAGKFLKWLASRPDEGAATDAQAAGESKEGDPDAPADPTDNVRQAGGQGAAQDRNAPASNGQDGQNAARGEAFTTNGLYVSDGAQTDGYSTSNGLYGMISGAFGVASSVTSGLIEKLATYASDDSSEFDDSYSDSPRDEEDSRSIMSYSSSSHTCPSGAKPVATEEKTPGAAAEEVKVPEVKVPEDTPATEEEETPEVPSEEKPAESVPEEKAPENIDEEIPPEVVPPEVVPPEVVPSEVKPPEFQAPDFQAPETIDEEKKLETINEEIPPEVVSEALAPESIAASHSEEAKSETKSIATATSQTNQDQAQAEKKLKELEDRRRKDDEKAIKMLQRRETKLQTDKEKDAVALAKMREKHEKEQQKRDEKYRRELKKIEEKREADARKAEAKRLKVADREEKSKLLLDLEKARVERDSAIKQVESLEAQIKELQSRNSMLARRSSEVGWNHETESTTSSAGSPTKRLMRRDSTRSGRKMSFALS